VLRRIRFLQKMQCTILSGHRRVRPFGLSGGEAGQLGENSVRRNDGRVEKLKACDSTLLEAGEAVTIKTPTAGGYGKPEGPNRRHLNADQKRALKAATVQVFMDKYGRKAQRGVEPNDRKYDRDIEKALKNMTPAELDKLLRDDEEE